MIEKIPLQIGSKAASSPCDPVDSLSAKRLSDEDQDLLRGEIRSSLETNDKGAVKNTIANYVTVFTQDPLLKSAIRFNLLTERIDIVGKLGWHRSSTILTDMDLHHLQYFCEQKYGLSSDKKMRSALNVVANNNCFHQISYAFKTLGINRCRLKHFFIKRRNMIRLSAN